MSRSYRKKIAGFLAATMMVNAFLPANAVSLVEASSGTDTGSGAIEGLVEKKIFAVELPAAPADVTQDEVNEDEIVSTPYDFYMDPKGIMKEQQTDKKFEPNTNLYFRNREEGAAYDFSHVSDALTIRNKSTMDVDVELDASVTGLDGIKLTRDEGFLNDTSASVYLALMDNRERTAPIDKYNSFLKATLKGSPKAYKVIYDEDEDKYKYQLKSDPELKASGITFPEYTFRMTGACNTKNGWSNLPEDIAPVVTATWKVSPRPANKAPSIGKTQYAMTSGRGIAIDVDLGAGNLAAKAIKTITFKNPAGAVTTFPTSNYKFVESRLVLNAACITNLVKEGVTSREYTVVFDDKAETQVKFVLSSDRSAPSIEQSSYKMEIDKDIEINVDLGSGDLAASGIKEIVFENGTKTFPAANYSLTGGKLVISGSRITSLIKGGVTSREYTIIFNDKAETTAEFTLVVDGRAPSITDSSNTYLMAKDADLIVNVDLGADYLEAQGIKAITFINASGMVSTFPADNYTFTKDDGRLVISKSRINSFINGGLVSREYTIVFDNAAETKAKFVLKAPDNDPSIIGGTDYPMVFGRGVAITMDLGSGQSRANGVKMVTFEKDGSVLTFPTSNYRFEGGKLTVTKDCTEKLIRAGIAPREYTVIFDNDKTVKFTLYVDGTAPSIAKQDYTMVKNTDIVVDMEMGTGSLAATGIKEITFVKSGVTTVFPASNYSYAGGRLTIDKSRITGFIQNGMISREYTIVFNNSIETKVNIVLTAQNTAPSIAGGPTFKMISGRGVAIPLDLGSGQLRATGIKTITVSKAGGTQTFPTTNYRVESEKVVITSACITKLLNGGVTSREYTIVFNNGVSTQAKFTLVR